MAAAQLAVSHARSLSVSLSIFCDSAFDAVLAWPESRSVAARRHRHNAGNVKAARPALSVEN